MTSSRNYVADVSGVLLAEQRRCQALENDDFATLKEIISPELTHTHARGNTDNFDSYFHHVQHRVEFVECKRGQLSVCLKGQIAIMTGPMQNIVRLRGASDDINVSAQVMQVWEWQDNRWLLLAFQATPLPPSG